MPDWEARFRARRLGLPDFARDDDRRTVVPATTAAGTLELHWWTVGGDEPVPATDRPEGTAHGTLDPSGRSLWWFDDRKGDEKGVWQRQDFGSAPGSHADATGLPHAVQRGSGAGRRARGGRQQRRRLRRPGARGRRRTAPARVLYEHEEEAYVGDLSRDESLLVIAHSEHGDSRHPALRVLRVDDGTTVGELWDGAGKGLEPAGFSPVAGDQRMLAGARARRRARAAGLGPGERRRAARRDRPARRGRGRRLVARRRPAWSSRCPTRPAPRWSGCTWTPLRRNGSGRRPAPCGRWRCGTTARSGRGGRPRRSRPACAGWTSRARTRARCCWRRPAPRRRRPCRSRTSGSTAPAGGSTRCCAVRRSTWSRRRDPCPW